MIKKLTIFLFILFLQVSNSYCQTLYIADSMESPSSWRGTSTMINSMFIGGVSTSIDNPPNYPMYSSPDTCYMVKGIGLGSSAAEVDTFTYANLPVTVGRTYEIRFKVASFGLSPITNTAAGVDGSTDTLEFQYRVAASSWFRDFKLIGSSNAMWTFNGAIGTNAKLTINRNANTTPNLYASNATNPITNVAIRLNPGTYQTIQIRFISKVNGSGETWMLDDVEVWDVTPTLPVELIEFVGNISEYGVELKWVTASETNNDHFDIFKSFDGINYELINSLRGQGTTNTLTTYRIYDNEPCNENVYYKLSQVDYDGNFKEYSPIVVSCRKINYQKPYKFINIIGQEVNEDYEGIKFIIYE